MKKESNKKANQYFLGIGRRELASGSPDRNWLEAVIHGIGWPNDRQGAELLVTIFERPSLPGRLRGDAADKLGMCRFVSDRRTSLFRRCRDTALCGLEDESIDVRFWSMYLIGSLCSNGLNRRRARWNGFACALPKLRQVAANDQRLAPGYWWPMSAEAKDVIDCVETGRWPDPDAAERWTGNATPIPT